MFHLLTKWFWALLVDSCLLYSPRHWSPYIVSFFHRTVVGLRLEDSYLLSNKHPSKVLTAPTPHNAIFHDVNLGRIEPASQVGKLLFQVSLTVACRLTKQASHAIVRFLPMANPASSSMPIYMKGLRRISHFSLNHSLCDLLSPPYIDPVVDCMWGASFRSQSHFRLIIDITPMFHHTFMR